MAHYLEKCTNEKQTILICANIAWNIVNFRLPLIVALRAEGYRVAILTKFDGYEKELAGLVDDIHPLNLSRKGLNPFKEMMTFLSIARCLIVTRPKVYLGFTIKPVIYGGLLCRVIKIKNVLTITGLGTAFLSRGLLHKIVVMLYGVALKRADSIFFQNYDDLKLFTALRIGTCDKMSVTSGSGIDLCQYQHTKWQINKNINFLFVGRVIYDKGIRELIEAIKLVINKYENISFSLLGPLDFESRSVVSLSEIHEWEASGLIRYLGKTDDVKKFIVNSDCVLLPSYREGLPRVLLEAGACYKPSIVSDVPGCRAVIKHGVNGFLCAPRDHLDLASKIEDFIGLSHFERRRLGMNSRKMVEENFDASKVCDQYVDSIEAINTIG